ncbi:MAG: dTDP-glucose 4,6-dehydratase [Oculatellaceae cyanobacterium bins.114]|nr:dTDP-glucose 4,6-dehydratase [Oculatellaceae cyanobacterium bins.114]
MTGSRRLLVTGGAGFIGSNFVHYWCEQYPSDHIAVLDNLSYAGNRSNLASLDANTNFRFVQGSISDRPLIEELLNDEAIDTVVHFAAESHVDRSILNPGDFVQTNIVGTFTLLDAFRCYWEARDKPNDYRFCNISTDEVFGSLEDDAPAFSESTPYAPNNPYSASKASADHIVRAYFQTYGLPTLTTNCSNNYGPYQFPEKLVPCVCTSVLTEQPIFIYGDGQSIRDWIHVRDHCTALDKILSSGKPGETYNIGGNNEVKNIHLVHKICNLLQELVPNLTVCPHYLIRFVADRPGHDRRYAIDATKIQTQLNWHPSISFEEGLKHTVQWYVEYKDWWLPLLNRNDLTPIHLKV